MTNGWNFHSTTAAARDHEGPATAQPQIALMIYRLGADLVLIAHLAFVLFVVLGSLLVARWFWLIWLHLAAVSWGALLEFAGLVCPLTAVEVSLRKLGGEAGYEGDFIGHYIIELLYPPGLTRSLQIWLGLGVLLLNCLIYGLILARKRRSRATRAS